MPLLGMVSWGEIPGGNHSESPSTIFTTVQIDRMHISIKRINGKRRLLVNNGTILTITSSSQTAKHKSDQGYTGMRHKSFECGLNHSRQRQCALMATSGDVTLKVQERREILMNLPTPSLIGLWPVTWLTPWLPGKARRQLSYKEGADGRYSSPGVGFQINRWLIFRYGLPTDRVQCMHGLPTDLARRVCMARSVKYIFFL